MEGMLCRWALALQEYDFKLEYRKGSLNTNVDALSCMPMMQTACALTMGLPNYSSPELRTAQLKDSTLSIVLTAREHSNELPSDRKWYRPPFQRYRQLWKQLVVDGVLCRQYYPCPLNKLLVVPILPAAFQKEVLLCNHQQQVIKV